MSTNKKSVHEYLNNTSFEEISNQLKKGGLTDPKKINEFRIIQKIAKSLTADEFNNHKLTLEDVAVKLTPQEMDVARGGRLYPPGNVVIEDILKGLATSNPIDDLIKTFKEGSPFNPN